MTDTATPAVTPQLLDEDELRAVSLDRSSTFVRGAGLVVESVTAAEVRAHIDLTAEHHTPWGIVHGGVYATAIESAASVGATVAVRDRGQVAVGLTNTTHFVRSLTGGRVDVVGVPVHQG